MKEINLIFNSTSVCSSSLHSEAQKEGEFVQSDRWFSTDYVDISNSYALLYELAANRHLMSVSFFDENRAYISGVGTTSSCDFTTVNGVVVIPEKARYARFMTFTGAGRYDAMQTPSVSLLPDRAAYRRYIRKYPYHNFVIACIGDSLTEGDIGSYIPGTGILRYRNYPHYLSQSFCCRTLNYGKCGYTAEGILNFYRSGQVDVSKADLILMMIGTNKGLTLDGDKQKMAYQALLDLIEQDKKNGARIVLITPPYITPTKPVVYSYVENAVAEVMKIAKERNLFVIDAHHRSPIQAEKEQIYQPTDGCHMVEGGYRVFANYIAEELTKLISVEK